MQFSILRIMSFHQWNWNEKSVRRGWVSGAPDCPVAMVSKSRAAQAERASEFWVYTVCERLHFNRCSPACLRPEKRRFAAADILYVATGRPSNRGQTSEVDDWAGGRSGLIPET